MHYQSISMQNRFFAYFSDFSHIGVDFCILICEFAYMLGGPDTCQLKMFRFLDILAQKVGF